MMDSITINDFLFCGIILGLTEMGCEANMSRLCDTINNNEFRNRNKLSILCS